MPVSYTLGDKHARQKARPYRTARRARWGPGRAQKTRTQASAAPALRIPWLRYARAVETRPLLQHEPFRRG